MERTWTEAQKAAIDERDRTLLVSAAAGSGKTAVLTERIIASLTDEEHPTDISKILAVTFTKAAAGELRQRISKALSKALSADPQNRHLTRQLMLLGSAKISTIDSFYFDLVRANHAAAGLPPVFRLAEEAELASLRRSVMESVIDQLFEEKPDFYRLADLFSQIRSEESLTDKLIDIATSVTRYPESDKIFLRSAQDIKKGADKPLETPHGQVFCDRLTELATQGALLLAKTLAAITEEPEYDKLRKKYAAYYTEVLDRCNALLAAVRAKDFEDTRKLLSKGYEANTRAGGVIGDISPRTQELLDLSRAFVKKLQDFGTALCVFSSDEIAKTAEETSFLLGLLYLTVDTFQKEYKKAKLSREVCEFSDISRAAYELLVDQNGDPTPLAKDISAQFDAIYIDEYQDVDAMQDATFRAISKPKNRFMVGDIKQSIYRFRGAQPAVFASYRHAFPVYDKEATSDTGAILMSNCFRCDENVIRFSNAVSSYLFSSCAEAIGYVKEDDLVFSKSKPTEHYISPKCQVMMVEKGKKLPEKPKLRAEVRMVAAEIDRLIREEKNADGTPIRPRDIAILFRSSDIASPLATALSAYGIAAKDTSQKNFFENPEVLCVYSLLATIDNPERDVYLAAALRSPFFGFSLEDLVAIRTAGDRELSLYGSLQRVLTDDTLADKTLLEKCAAFAKRLAEYQKKADSLAVDKLIRYLYRDTAVLSFHDNEEGEGALAYSRRANLQRLYEYARKFEANGFRGLFQFIRYIDDLMKNEALIPSPEADTDAVSLITIHHSKGLEFPVCFIVGAASPFNTKDQQETLLCDERLGAALRVCNAGAFSRANTFFREGLRLELDRLEREEQMRVLYVAMTRARERLYITGQPQFGTDKLFSDAALCGSCESRLFHANGRCYLDWVISALQGTEHDEFCKITVINERDVPAVGKRLVKENEAFTAEPDENASALLRERFAFVYPQSHLAKLPAKLSVSRLSPIALDVFDTDGAPTPSELDSPDAQRLLHTFERAPSFGQDAREANGAERGTATHEFLQFCDFEAAEKDIEGELARLVSLRFLPSESQDLIRKGELRRFFESDFYRLLKGAKRLHRETRFHIALPASHFTKDKALKEKLSGESLMVQGVIDLFFVDAEGNLVLCDYKTDRLEKEALNDPALAAQFLFDRHGDQLSYYAEALRQICGRAPDRVLIYSLPLGRALEKP